MGRGLHQAGVAAIIGLVIIGCSDRGGEAVAHLRADPLATRAFAGLIDFRPTRSSPGRGGGDGSPATVTRVLRVTSGDLDAGVDVVAAMARANGWEVETRRVANQPSLVGRKRVSGDAASLSVLPVPRRNGTYGSELEIELSIRW